MEELQLGSETKKKLNWIERPLPTTRIGKIKRILQSGGWSIVIDKEFRREAELEGYYNATERQ